MAAQHTLMVVPATLFSTTPGSEDDLGACERISECLVALVALATLPTPKFRIVCYTRDQRTLCAVRLQESACDGQLTIPARSSSSSSPNVDLLHLRDGSDARVFVLHLMAAEDGERLLAAVAAALYTMAGSPAHTTYSYDATRRSSNLPGPFLQVGDEAQAHYRAYTTRHMGTSPLLEVLPSQPTWKQHTFRAISSTASLLHTSRGFEGSTLGMRPGSTRIVVVPPELPNRSPAANSSHAVEVYILYLPREAPTPEAPPPSCVPPTLAIPDWDDDDGKKKKQTAPACRGSSANIVPDAAPSSMLELRLELHAAMTAADELQQVGAAIDDAVRRSSRQHEVTVLPPESLIAKVQDFVAEHKRLEGELQDRDRTLCLLDERTMHLKKKLEESSAAAQALMDGQKEAAMTCINEKLRADRQALQLQEKVAQLINTKEDHRRHLETTRSLLHLCEEEVRRARAQRTGKEDEASQLRQALDRVKEDLHRERSRHGSLESTLAAQQEQILALRADMRGKTVQVQELKMMADAERDAFMRRLEELRREKAAEVRGVRDDAMQQLEHLDATHRQHMAQEAESAYKRGRKEGMTQGMQNESEDVAMVQQERSIAAERRAAELTACRTELRTSIETASTVRRALLSAVDGLRREVSEAAARKAEWDRRLQEKKGTQHGVFVRRVRHFVSHLHDRVTPAQLLDVLRQLRESNDADVGFLAHNREEARRESLSRRARWVEEELLYIYKRGEEHYFDEWRNALMEAHRTTVQAVRTLWVQHSGMAHYQLHVAEVEGRVTIQQEWSGGFHAVQKWYADLLAERESLWKEAVVAMNDSWKESMEECARINRWANALLAEQEYCLGSEEHARLRIATGAMTSLAGIVAEGTARIFALRVGELMGMESGAREAISTEESAEMVSYVASLDRLRSHWRQHQAQHTPANMDPTPRTTTPPRVAVQEEEEDFSAPPRVLVEDVHETRPSPPRALAERSSPSDASPIPFQPSLPDEAPPPPQDDESEAVDVQPVCEAHVPEEVPRNFSPSPQTAALFAVNFDDAPPEMEED